MALDQFSRHIRLVDTDPSGRATFGRHGHRRGRPANFQGNWRSSDFQVGRLVRLDPLPLFFGNIGPTIVITTEHGALLIAG